MRFVFPWAALAQANHRLTPIAFYDRERQKWVGRLVSSTDYKNAAAAAAMVARAQYNGPPLEGPVSVSYQFFEPDRRVRDPSNFQKMIEDVLEEIAYTNDTQICDLHWERTAISRSKPRVVVTVFMMPLFTLREET